MEQQQQQVSREAVAGVGMESGQQQHHQQQQEQHHQQQQHQWQQQQSELDSFGPDSRGSATLLGPFGAMAETLNAGTAEADKAGLDAVAKPRTTESPPAAAAATGYMEMGQMSDFEILAHEKGDESDVSPAGVRVELEMPKNWTCDFEAQTEAFYPDPSTSVFQDLSTGHGERFATAGLSEVDLNKAAGSPHSDEGQQIESCDSSPADDIVTVFPTPSTLFTESAVASFQGRGSPEAVGSLSGKTSPSEDKTPKKATSPDKPMEKLIFLAQGKYLDTTVPQKRESDDPSDGEVLTKNPRKDERAEALKPRDTHVGEKQPVVYHPGYSEAETISISQESSPLEEISPISEEFTDKLIVASDEVQMQQPSTEMEYSISLSQESSPGEDSSPVTGNLGHVFPKPSAAATTVQQQQLAGIDSSEEKQVPIAKKDNSLTSSYVSSSTEESSPGEEGVRVVGGGSKSGEKEDFVEEVAPLSHEEERSPHKTESRAGVDGKEPGFAVESLGASWGSEDDWPASEGVRAAEPAVSSKGDLGGRVAGGNVAEETHLGDKSPEVPPTRGAAAGGWHAEGPREEQTAVDAHAANDFMDFDVGSAKQPQQQPQQQPRQQEPAVAVSVAKFDTPPSAVRVIDSEEEEDDDDDEYENEFYSEETVASAAAPWVQKSLITVEEEELSKPGKVTVIPEPLGGPAGPPPQAAAAVEPKGPVVAPAAATAGPAPVDDKEEEPKGSRPSQPPPTWPGFGPPTVIIEEAAEEGGAEREEPAPEVRPRGKPSEAAVAAAAAAAAAAEEEKQPEVEKKLPAKAEEGKSRQSFLEKIHLPAVSELVYWRDPRWSGGVLGVLLLLLLSIAHLSVFTIVGYLGLLMLTCTITWRVCRGVLCAVQKREDGHPFRTYLAEDVDVTRERMSRQVEAARVWTTGAATELRRLLLVQDLVDSLKFAGVLWLMTYVGSVFNGLSLLILGVVLLFSVPIAYEKKKTEVDHYLALVQAKVDDATARVKSMIPAALRPNEANSSAK